MIKYVLMKSYTQHSYSININFKELLDQSLLETSKYRFFFGRKCDAMYVKLRKKKLYQIWIRHVTLLTFWEPGVIHETSRMLVPDR